MTYWTLEILNDSVHNVHNITFGQLFKLVGTVVILSNVRT